MSSNPDELKHNEIKYIQYLYYKLYDTYLLNSITYIIELKTQELINTDKPINKVSILIDKKLNNIPLEKFLEKILEIRSLLKDKVFKYFSDIVKFIPPERRETEINNKIIISDLYYFMPLIIELINFYYTYLQILHKICAEFIKNITRENINLTTNTMFLNALNSTYFSIILLEQLLHFIKTREIKKDFIENEIDFHEKEIKFHEKEITNITISSNNEYEMYIQYFKSIVLYFLTKKTYPIIDINNFIDYLHKYIEYNNKIITVIHNDRSNMLYVSFIIHIKMLLTTYFTKINNTYKQYIDYNNLNKLFDTIKGNNYINDELIALLKKIISSISIMNANFYNYYQQKEGYILHGINIIILLNKLIEYLYCNDFIITYNPNSQYILIEEDTFTKNTFLKYIKDEIYPSINFNITGRNTINEDITFYFTNSPSNRKKPSIRRSKSIKRQFSIRPNPIIIIDNLTEIYDILIFINILEEYVVNFFKDVHFVKDDKLNDILYENNEQDFKNTLLSKNIRSLFKNISNKITNIQQINDSIFYLLKYIIDLTINICIILVKLRDFNKILLQGIVNINLLNKLINFLNSKTPITYSEYDYTNIEINTSKQHVMNFLLDNNIEYDLTTDIIKLNDNKIDKIDEIEIYNNIYLYIMKMNHQYNYSGDIITVFGGGHLNNKYKKTENKITVIYKKKEYTRVIYICERKKYIKINKTFILLSKLKKV